MKPTLIFAIACVFFTTVVESVVNAQVDRERKKDAPAVEEQLKEFERGTVSLDNLTADGGAPLRQKIIQYYSTNTNRVSVKMKLVISRCFAMEQDFQRAAQLAESYVAVYTNDYRGWRILGAASTMLDQNVRALDAYRRATKLGDETGFTPMARAALELNRLDVVREISPQLLRLRHSKALPTVVNLDVVGLLVIYARLSDDREVFLKTLEGMKAEDIVPRDDVASEVNKACKKFQAAEVDVLCQKVNEAVERQATEQRK